VVLMQFCIAASVACVAFCLKMPGTTWLAPVLALLALSAILGATQDIGSDGVYVTTLPPKEMAKYTGFQSMCWNAGFLLASGPLIYFSGTLHERSGDWGSAWMVIMLVISGLLVLAALFHSRFLPPGAKALDAPKTFGDAMRTFGHAFATFFQKKDIWKMLAFAFFYRSGYGLIDKIGPLFMIDERAKGGLGLSNQVLGNIYGTFGNGAFIVGSLVGGWLVSRMSLKKSLLILCLCLNVPNVTFLILSQTLPTNYGVIATIVTFEKLAWGIGCVGHMIYMMQQIAPGPYRTAHYTFATALMGACMMTTGAVSGYLQSQVGYQWFFIIVLFAALPSILVTVLAPFHNPDTTGRSADLQPEAFEAS
jgi:PAT family beta-lactamase induction signal transducer AmpG